MRDTFESPGTNKSKKAGFPAFFFLALFYFWDRHMIWKVDLPPQAQNAEQLPSAIAGQCRCCSSLLLSRRRFHCC